MVTFANGRQLETIAVYGSSMSFQNAQRSTLELVVSADKITLDEAKSIWKDAEMTAEITITDGNETSVHLNYTLPVELKANSLDGVDVIRIKLAQKSNIEIAQEKQATDIAACEAAIIDIGELLGGE